MVVIMEPGVDSALIVAVAERIADLGLVAQTTVGVHQTIVAALGDTAGRDDLDAEPARAQAGRTSSPRSRRRCTSRRRSTSPGARSARARSA
jgi:hypothetical protein